MEEVLLIIWLHIFQELLPSFFSTHSAATDPQEDLVEQLGGPVGPWRVRVN